MKTTRHTTKSRRQASNGGSAFNFISSKEEGAQDKSTNILNFLGLLTIGFTLWIYFCFEYKNFNHLVRIQAWELGFWGLKKGRHWEDLGRWKEETSWESTGMAQSSVDELVVRLEGSLEIFTMEQGVKLIGAVLANQQLNKWGVRNILRSAWSDLGEVAIHWVKENLFIIIVKDERGTAVFEHIGKCQETNTEGRRFHWNGRSSESKRFLVNQNHDQYKKSACGWMLAL